MGYVFGGSGGGGGGAPTGAAGGDLGGTYPNPTVTAVEAGVVTNAMVNASAAIAKSKLAALAIADADVAGGAAIAYSKLALTGAVLNADLAGSIALAKLATDPLARANHTGTQVMATISDAGALATKSAVASADITDGTIAGGDLSATIAIPSGATATTPAANTNTTALATTAYNVAQAKLYGAMYQIGPGTFANMPPMTATTSIATPNAGDARFWRVQMSQSGTLHDVSFLCGTTGGNYNIIVMDDGQANATHTVRTALYIKGSTATPAGGTWMTGDAALAVNAGDTLVFMLAFDGTTAKAVSAAGSSTGAGTLPNSSFFPGSGASTANQKFMGTVLSANVPTTTSGAGSTVTDANFVTAVNFPLVVWRIA